MDKRWITGLLLAISIALLGLVGIQVKWMRDTMVLREAQFEHSVDNALFTVCDRMEQLEKMGHLKRHKAGRRLLVKLDAMRRYQWIRAGGGGNGGDRRSRQGPDGHTGSAVGSRLRPRPRGIRRNRAADVGPRGP